MFVVTFALFNIEPIPFQGSVVYGALLMWSIFQIIFITIGFPTILVATLIGASLINTHNKGCGCLSIFGGIAIIQILEMLFLINAYRLPLIGKFYPVIGGWPAFLIVFVGFLVGLALQSTKSGD
jgi:hypothetical protein